MTADERHARFLAVVARAMAKPLRSLPYREPVRTRYQVRDVVESAPMRTYDGRQATVPPDARVAPSGADRPTPERHPR